MLDCGFNRLKILLNINEEKRGNRVSVNVYYLVENSKLDNVSHFVLRLLCLYSEEFIDFFVKTETQFFKYRIDGVDWSTVFDALKSLKEELGHTIEDYCYKELREFHIYCTDLIRKREVELRNGFCLVHCGAWKSLLGCIFHFHHKYVVENIKRFINIRNLELDERIDLVVRPLLAFWKQWKNDGRFEWWPPMILSKMVAYAHGMKQWDTYLRNSKLRPIIHQCKIK